MVSLYSIKRYFQKSLKKLDAACGGDEGKKREENYYKVKIDSRGRMQISLYGPVQVRNCLSDIMDVLGRELNYDDEEDDDTGPFGSIELFNREQLERFAYMRELHEDLEKKINNEKDDPDVPTENVEGDPAESDEEFEAYFAQAVKAAQERKRKEKDLDEDEDSKEGSEEEPDPEAS